MVSDISDAQIEHSNFVLSSKPQACRGLTPTKRFGQAGIPVRIELSEYQGGLEENERYQDLAIVFKNGVATYVPCCAQADETASTVRLESPFHITLAKLPSHFAGMYGQMLECPNDNTRFLDVNLRL